MSAVRLVLPPAAPPPVSVNCDMNATFINSCNGALTNRAARRHRIDGRRADVNRSCDGYHLPYVQPPPLHRLMETRIPIPPQGLHHRILFELP